MTSCRLLPSGYPADLERHITLAGGRTVFVRPIVPEDAVALERALEDADPETVYQRFLRSSVRLDPDQLVRLTLVDYRNRLALVAFGPDGEGAGIARYELLEPGVAEIAVVVDPAWRGLGLAGHLIQMLEQAAMERDITEFAALHLPDNHRIGRLLDRLGFEPGPYDGGLATATKHLVDHRAA